MRGISDEQDATNGQRGIPGWFWVVAIGLALIQPVLHIWLQYFPPPGTAPTGLLVSDTVVFRHCLRMFETGFESSHATCQSPWGAQDIRYFSSPLHWLYGVLGPVGRLLHIPEFIYLGVLNGLGMFAYLVAAYFFLRAAVPKHANLSWLLFALATGPGGVAYLVSGLFGWSTVPNFDQLFWRFAYYDLMEGANLWPMLHMARLYYTIPLALGLGAFTLLIHATRNSAKPFTMAFMAAAMLVTTFINIRVGPMLGIVAVLFLLFQQDRPARERMRLGAAYLLPILAGLFAAWLMLRTRESYAVNAFQMTSIAMWIGPFLYAAVFHIVLGIRPAWRMAAALPKPYRVVAYALGGYLVALLLLYAGYQAYWGNWWYGGDDSAARTLSNWALIGALLGAVAGWISAKRRAADSVRPNGWIVLWLLLFLAIAPSAFGNGWFLQFGPQRFMVLLGLPMAIMAAKGIALLEAHRPTLARGAMALMIACGITSIETSWFVMQGPLGPLPGQGPYPWMRLGLILETDKNLLDTIDEGVVLAPAEKQPFFGDIASLKPGVSTVFGTGTLDLSTQLSLEMRAEVERFFDPTTPEADRKAFVDEWCVDYIYFPAMHPVGKGLSMMLLTHDWLKLETAVPGAGVWRVVR